MHYIILVKVLWTTQNAEHIARHGVVRGTVEEIFEARDAVIVAGQPKGRWVIEATVEGALYRVVFTRSGPGEVYPITAHRIRRRRSS